MPDCRFRVLYFLQNNGPYDGWPNPKILAVAQSRGYGGKPMANTDLALMAHLMRRAGIWRHPR